MRALRMTVVVVALVALSAAAMAAPIITLNEVGGDPVVIRHTGGYNRSHPLGLTMRRTSQMLYFGQTYNGGVELHKFDATVTKKLSEANAAGNDANTGVVNHYSGANGYRQGSVASGPTPGTNTYALGDAAWNPTTDTVMTRRCSVYDWFGVDEVIAQSASEAWSVINEGVAVANGGPQVTTVAVASRTTASVPNGSILDVNGGGGMAFVDNVNIGGTDYDRCFVGLRPPNSNNPPRRVGVFWMTDAILTNPPTAGGWDATTVGSRTTLQMHNNNSAQSLLLDEAAYGALVGVADDEVVLDLAVYDNTLFILSYSSGQGDAYLSALEYSLPTDGSTAVSVTGVVNLGGATDYLVLDSMVDGICAGYGGIDFGAAGGDTLMYIASTDGLVYTFNVAGAAAPIPEPAGLSLIGLALMALRRKRR